MTLTDGVLTGYREAAAIHRHGETPKAMGTRIESVRERIEADIAARVRKASLSVKAGCMGRNVASNGPSLRLGQCRNIVDFGSPWLFGADRVVRADFRWGMVNCHPQVWGCAK